MAFYPSNNSSLAEGRREPFLASIVGTPGMNEGEFPCMESSLGEDFDARSA